MVRNSKDGCSQDGVNRKNSRGYPRTAAVFIAVALFVCVVGTALAGTAAAQADSVTVETQPNATQTAGEVITGDGAPYPQANVTNSTGAPVSGVNVTVEAVGGAGNLTASSTTTNQTNASGIATFDNLVITNADTYRLNFSINDTDANVDASDSNETQQFEVEAAGASLLLPVTTPGQTQTAGEVITGPPQVIAEDTYGNPVENVDVDVVATNASGSITAGTTTNQTNASGIATFDDLVIETADTGYELEFSIDPADSNVENAASLLTPPFDVEAANANTVEVQQQPLITQTAGQTIDGPPTVLVTDEFGNPVQGVDVDVAEVGGYTFDSGTTTVATDGSGLSTFSDLIINETGTYTLEFSIDDADANVDVADTNQTNPFDVEAAAVDGITAFDVTATAGQQGEINVTAEDQYGNLVQGEDISVDDDAGLSGVNNGDTQTTGADGNATFTFNEQTAGDYTLTFSAQGGTPTDTATVTVEPDAADNVTAVAVTDTATADGTDTVEYDVTVEDQFGNAVQGVEVVTMSNGTSIGYGGDDSQTTDANGQVTVTANSTDAPQTVEFTFTEQQNSNTDTATGTFEVGQPAQVTATQNVGTATADGVDELDYTVTVEDANNNPVEGVGVNTTDDGTNVDYAGDDTQTTDVSGQVVVTATSTTAQDVNFTFTEQQNSNSDTATGTFEAGNASGLNLAFDQASLGDGDGNTNQLTVNVRDAEGNPVPDENVTLTVEQGSGGLVVAGANEGQNTTVSTDANGEFESEVLYQAVESDAGTTVVVEGTAMVTEQASFDVESSDRRGLSRGQDSDAATGMDRRDRSRGSDRDRSGNRRSRGRGR